MKMLARFKNAKDTRFELSREDGRTYLTCSALDGELPFISVKMLITDESQGFFIKERFLENPAKIFSSIIELLTK